MRSHVIPSTSAFWTWIKSDALIKDCQAAWSLFPFPSPFKWSKSTVALRLFSSHNPICITHRVSRRLIVFCCFGIMSRSSVIIALVINKPGWEKKKRRSSTWGRHDICCLRREKRVRVFFPGGVKRKTGQTPSTDVCTRFHAWRTMLSQLLLYFYYYNLLELLWIRAVLTNILITGIDTS